MSEKEIVPDWYVVAFDETKYWNLEKKDKRFIEKMVGVYFFDKNSQTHVAELTPSYYLAFGYNTIWFKRTAYTDKNERNDLRGELDQKYLYGPGVDNDGTYMHVSSLDAYTKKHKKMVYHYGKTDEDSSDGGEEEVREYINGNPPF